MRNKLLAATILSFILLPFLFLSTKVLAQYGSYSVSGYVFDDINANGVQDGGERGILGMTVYADNSALGQKGYTDQTGYFRIDNLPAGAHSIEIYNAGALGSRPTSSEKISVSGPSYVRFGVQKGGYDVQGYVRDQYGRPLAGVKVYVDFPSRQTAITNNFGYYLIKDVGYDSSTPIWGFSGGHNIYVEGYDTNPVLLNPQYATSSMPADFTVRSDQQPPYYPPYPYPGQCTPGAVVSTIEKCFGQQLCSVNMYSRADCSQYEGSPYNCQLVYGQCNYQQPPYQPQPPTYGSPSCTVSASPSYGNVPFYSTITAYFNSGGNSGLYPNYYAFTIGGIGHEAADTNSTHSFSWSFQTVGTHNINLNLRYNGGTVYCSVAVSAYQGYSQPGYPPPYDPPSEDTSSYLQGQTTYNDNLMDQNIMDYYNQPVYDQGYTDYNSYGYDQGYGYDSYNSYDSGYSAYDGGGYSDFGYTGDSWYSY